MERKIYLVKRHERILLDDPSPELSHLDIKKLKGQYPILEESSYNQFYESNYKLSIHEFKPYSEASFDEIYKLIFSEDFGIVPLCINFTEHISSISPTAKIISILNHTVELEPYRLIYSEAWKIVFREFKRHINDDLDTPSKNPKSLNNLFSECSYKEIDELNYKCFSFQTSYFTNLGEKIAFNLQQLFDFYDLKFYKKRIENKISIINQDKELLIISPLIYDFNQWTKILDYEFSILENEYFRILFKKKIVSYLNQLKNRIGFDKIPNISNDRFYDQGNIFFTPSNITKPDFQIPLAKYTHYVENFKIDDSPPFNNHQLISKLSKKNKNKIILNQSPKKLNSILLKLFELNGVTLDEDMKNRIKRFIKNCFEIKPKYSFESTSIETINFLNSGLREKLLKLLYVLNELDIVKYKSSRHLYLVLINELKDFNNENIGLSESTLKPLLSELSNEKNHIKNIIKDVGFESLTSLRSPW